MNSAADSAPSWAVRLFGFPSAFLAWVALCNLLISPASASEPGKRLRVLTTFLPLYCFAVNVAGQDAQVENLLPANVSPHEYQFSRRDLQKVQSADLIIVNGLGMESWVDKMLHASQGQNRIVTATAGLEAE